MIMKILKWFVDKLIKIVRPSDEEIEGLKRMSEMRKRFPSLKISESGDRISISPADIYADMERQDREKQLRISKTKELDTTKYLLIDEINKNNFIKAEELLKKAEELLKKSLEK